MLDNRLSGKALVGIGILVIVLNVFTLISKLQPHLADELPPDAQSGYQIGVYLFQVFMIGMGVVLIVKGLRRR